jgi:hypothetical protein
MNSNWIKWLLIFAAAWNLVGGSTSLADPASHFAQMYTVAPPADDALLMFFYQSTWINVLAWGGAYLLAAFWAASRRAVLIAGGAGKAAYFVASVALVGSGVGQPLVLVFGLGDLAMALLFGWAALSQLRIERDGLAWGRGMKPDEPRTERLGAGGGSPHGLERGGATAAPSMPCRFNAAATKPEAFISSMNSLSQA